LLREEKTLTDQNMHLGEAKMHVLIGPIFGLRLRSLFRLCNGLFGVVMSVAASLFFSTIHYLSRTTFSHPSPAHNFMMKFIFKILHLSLAIFFRTSKRKKEAPPHRGLETDRLKDR